VTITIKSRIVTVTGPRGSLVRNFKHCPIDMQISEDGNTLQLDMWFSNKKQLSTLGSIASHINNMFTGVVQVRYRPRARSRWGDSRAGCRLQASVTSG
jgi:large subunit ribosomal protein L9e